MAPPPRPRPLPKNGVSKHFTARQPLVFSENTTRSSLVPNIRSISWSPTGSMVAHSFSAQVRVWNPDRPDVNVSTELRDPTSNNKAHTQVVEKVVFNPTTESMLATGAIDGFVKLWDARLPGGMAGFVGGGGIKGSSSFKNTENKVGTNHKCLFLTWHPDGTQLLAGREDDIILAFDVRKADIPYTEISSAAVAVSNTTSSTTANFAGPTKIQYELISSDRTPNKESWCPETKIQLNQMSFTNSGRELLVPTTQGFIAILSYPDLTLLHNLPGHQNNVYCVQQSPRGDYIAAGGTDSLVTIWDTTSMLCTQVLKRQTAAVRDLSFSFDGSLLVTGAGTEGSKDGDKGLNIYHVDTGDLAHTVETHNPVRDVAWHPLRYAVAYSGDPGGLKIAGSLG